MPGLSKAEAARQMGISRTTLYKLIDSGKLSAQPDGTIDPTELVRAVSTLSISVHRERPHVHHEHIEVNSDTTENEHIRHVQSEHPETPMDRPTGHRFTDLSVQREQVDTLREMIALLRDQLDRKDAQIAHLSGRLEQWEQRYDRLLAAPITAPTPTAAPEATLTPERLHWPADTHERILDFMQVNPGPHTANEVQDALELARSPKHILRHMVVSGRLTRTAPGRYAYPGEVN